MLFTKCCYLILSLAAAVTYSFSWISPALSYPRSAITRGMHRVASGRDVAARRGPSQMRHISTFTTHLVVHRPFMSKLSNQEKNVTETAAWHEDDPLRIRDDQEWSVKRPTLFGLEPKQEVDPLDNGLPVLGPIIVFLQFYIAYMLFSEIPLTEIQDAIP